MVMISFIQFAFLLILVREIQTQRQTLPSFFDNPRLTPTTQSSPFSLFGRQPPPFSNTSLSNPSNFFGVDIPKAKTSTSKVSPGNLSCYSCRLDFRKGYETTNLCLGRHSTNISDQYLVNCGPSDIYCRVERTEVNGMLIFLTRECIDVCYYGCRPKGFGINFEACAECCQTFACNDFYPISSATKSGENLIVALLSLIAFRGWLRANTHPLERLFQFS